MPDYTAKEIKVQPIKAADANALVKRLHYSGKVVNNSQLHLGVFLGGRLEGVMQFGPSLDKRKIQGLVLDTGWNGFIELNRMAFSDRLPRNSESRAIGIAMRMIRKHYPHIEWVISFADGTQCGDGTIYRASGFVLTSIKKNDQIWAAPEGETFARMSLTDGKSKQQQQQARNIINRVSSTKGPAIMHAMSGRAGGAAAAANAINGGAASMKGYAAAGFKPLDGYQLRYIYFINPEARSRLNVPILPFSKIDEIGARMYKGERRPKQATTGDHPEQRRGSTDPDAPASESAQ